MAKTKSNKFSWSNRLTALGLALLSGALVVVSIPEIDIWPLGWIALVPLLIAIRGRSFWGAFFYGLVTGYVANAGAFYWIFDLLKSFGHLEAPVAIGLMVVLNIYQAMTFAFSAAATVKIRQKASGLPLVIVFPMVFTGFEFLMPFIFPWFMSNGQLGFKPFIQSFDLFGVSGGTFVMMTFTAAVAVIIENRAIGKRFPVVQVVYGLALPVLCVAYGLVRQQQVQKIVAKAPKFKVGVVEPNIGIWEKEVEGPDGRPISMARQEHFSHLSLLRLQFLSHKLEKRDHPDLLLWPESGYYPWWKVLYMDSDRFALAAGRLGAVVGVAHNGAVSLVKDLGNTAGRTINSIAAAGNNCYAMAGTRGYMVIHNADGESTHSLGNDRDMLSVAVNKDCDRVVAVGEGGIVVEFDKGQWKQPGSPGAGTLRAVVYAEDGFYIGGDNGVLLYLGKKGLKPVRSGTTKTIYSLHWSREHGLVIGGAQGLLIAWKGGAIQRFNTNTDRTIRGVFGGRKVYAVSGGGWLVRCAHAECTRLATHTRSDLNAISGNGNGTLYAAGMRGTLLSITAKGVKKLHNPLKNDLFSVTTVPYTVGYPFSDKVKFLYRSRSRLPPMKTWKDAGAAASRDKVPMEDWCTAMRGFSTPVMFGALTENGDPGHRKVFNSALLVNGDGGVLGIYKKVHLLVFGEYLPFEHEFPFLRRYFGSAGNLSPGKSLEVLSLGKVKIGPLICYEAIIPSISRKLAQKGVDFFVNMTNDAWFGKTAERYQHFYLAAFRSIENRKYLVRVTSNGISAVVDPFGNIIRQTTWVDADAFSTVISRLRIPTLYQQVGDAVPYMSLVFTFGLLLIPNPKKKKKKPARVSIKKKKGVDKPKSKSKTRKQK